MLGILPEHFLYKDRKRFFKPLKYKNIDFMIYKEF